MTSAPQDQTPLGSFTFISFSATNLSPASVTVELLDEAELHLRYQIMPALCGSWGRPMPELDGQP